MNYFQLKEKRTNIFLGLEKQFSEQNAQLINNWPYQNFANLTRN